MTFSKTALLRATCLTLLAGTVVVPSVAAQTTPASTPDANATTTAEAADDTP